jgi:hypothetical protein
MCITEAGVAGDYGQQRSQNFFNGCWFFFEEVFCAEPASQQTAGQMSAVHCPERNFATGFTDMKKSTLRFVTAMLCLLLVPFAHTASAAKKWFPGHYIYTHGFSTPSNGMLEPARQYVLNNPVFKGYHGLYYWSDLETSPGVYNFSRITRDLDRAQADGKKMIVMLLDTNWRRGSSQSPVPSYMLNNSQYQGGDFLKSVDSSGKGQRTAKLWVPALADQRAKFFTAMGNAIDSHPALALVILPETALATNPELNAQPGYSAVNLYDGWKKVQTAVTNAFQQTILIHYVNYGNAGSTQAMRDEMMAHLVKTLKQGFGGPDILAPLGALDNQFGKYYGQYAGVAPISISNQNSGYRQNNAKTVFEYAVDKVGAHFVSWVPVEYNWNTGAVYSIREVIDYVNAQNGRVNNSTPSNVSSGGGSTTSLAAPTNVSLTTQ